jgi:hypothetical protein
LKLLVVAEATAVGGPLPTDVDSEVEGLGRLPTGMAVPFPTIVGDFELHGVFFSLGWFFSAPARVNGSCANARR